jgi:protein-S-isoprenylcysteine O-methyltransferase Ste14
MMVGTFTRVAIPALWLGWILYWIIAAGNVKETRWHEPRHERIRHSLPFLIAFGLIIVPGWRLGVLGYRFLPDTSILPLIGTAIVALALGFACWARVHLGRNWSGTITLKEDHALITTGPYAFVRHPIYTGILFGFVGTALAIGEWRGLLAIVSILIGIEVRCSAEERKMRETFPNYDDYVRRTKRLVPFIY